MPKQIEVVVIHGSHKSADAVTKVGEPVTLLVSELKALDPQFSFKKGIGERFATPKAAEKLNLKRQLEDELEADGSEDDEDEAEAEEEAADNAAATTPTPPAEPAAKKRAPKKGKG
jgi:hypothetical protein